MILSYAITTIAKVKAQLGITDTSKDSLLETLVNQVTAFAEGFCGGRRFMSHTVSNEMHDTNGGNNVFLKDFPITALSSVEYRSGSISSPTWNTYSPEGYLLYADEGYVHFFGKLPTVHQGLRFNYVAGYLIDWAHEDDETKHTLPFDLTGVATDLVCQMYLGKDNQNISSLSTEGQSVTFATPDKVITPMQESILGNYIAYRLTR